MSYNRCPEGVLEAILNDDLEFIHENYPHLNPNCIITIDNRINKVRTYPIIQIAIENERLDIIEYLIGQGANLEARNSYNQTALHVALEINNPDIILLLYDAGSDLSVLDSQNNSPLMYAVHNNDYDIVKLFLDEGVDPNHVNIYGETVLHDASRNGYFEIVKLLLDYGSDPSILNNDHNSPENVASNQIIASYIRNYVPSPEIKEPEE